MSKKRAGWLGIFTITGAFLCGLIFPIFYGLIPSARSVHKFDDFAPFLLYWYIFWLFLAPLLAYVFWRITTWARIGES